MSSPTRPSVQCTESDRPRLLDVCCCAGAASRGYWLAGFAPTGVDITPQPNYPYPFVQASLLDLDPA